MRTLHNIVLISGGIVIGMVVTFVIFKGTGCLQ
jgi:hypothetical protein